MICEKHPCRHLSKVLLRCPNHPEKRWYTKNISPIGSRTIFYNLFSLPEMGPECPCDGDLLQHVCEPSAPANFKPECQGECVEGSN